MVVYTICRTPPRARYLPLRHAEKILGKGAYSGRASVPEELDPGQERLYSYYLPPLVAGPHTITTSQVVTLGNQQLNFDDEQKFTVVAPRYSLPDGSIHCVYPPQGHAENVEILPHVVLNDPHLPWTRRVTKEQESENERNRVPWLALLVFAQEELRLEDSSGFKQNDTLAVNLSLKELLQRKVATPVLDTRQEPWKLWDGDSEKTKANFIFVRKDLFGALFRSYEEDDQRKYDVSNYQWMAHMRHVNTTGMANSGIDGEKGSFGVVISHRTGPLNLTAPTDLMVHLVSIENIPSLKYPAKAERIALCSLDSWTYTCLPPNSFNVADGFQNIGSTLDVLRIDEEKLKQGLGPNKSLPKRLSDRMLDGYSMTRYRTQTGEETAAWIRGPFVPTTVKHEVRNASHSGTELQVLDKVTGIMDVTYSVAWQLGKTLALADQVRQMVPK